MSEEELEQRREAFLNRGLDVDGRPLKNENEGQLSDAPSHSQLTKSNAPLPVSDRTRYIFNACMKECELEPEVLVVEGARHEAVKSLLSVGATQLLTKEEFLGVLSEQMPNNWQDKNIQDLVNDFYTKYFDPAQKMTQFQVCTQQETVRAKYGKRCDREQRTHC